LDLFRAHLDHHGEYSAVSITVQNLVMIDAVVVILLTLKYLVHLAGNSLLTPQIEIFGQFSTVVVSFVARTKLLNVDPG